MYKIGWSWMALLGTNLKRRLRQLLRHRIKEPKMTYNRPLSTLLQTQASYSVDWNCHEMGIEPIGLPSIPDLGIA